MDWSDPMSSNNIGNKQVIKHFWEDHNFTTKNMEKLAMFFGIDIRNLKSKSKKTIIEAIINKVNDNAYLSKIKIYDNTKIEGPDFVIPLKTTKWLDTDFQCAKCHNRFEVMLEIESKIDRRCPHCGVINRIITERRGGLKAYFKIETLE